MTNGVWSEAIHFSITVFKTVNDSKNFEKWFKGISKQVK